MKRRRCRNWRNGRRWRGRQPAAVGPLLSAAEDTAVSPIVFILSLLLATLVVGIFIIQFSHVEFSVENLLGWTYQNEDGFNASTPISHPDFAYRVWVVALSIGYLVQFLHVRAHDSDVKRFVERFNPIAEAEGLPAIRLRFRGWAYFRPLWILAAVILAVYHAWWGIPLILAGLARALHANHEPGHPPRTGQAGKGCGDASTDAGDLRSGGNAALRQPALHGAVEAVFALCALRRGQSRGAAGMKLMYIIVCATGWVWTIFALAWLGYRRFFR